MSKYDASMGTYDINVVVVITLDYNEVQIESHFAMISDTMSKIIGRV